MNFLNFEEVSKIAFKNKMDERIIFPFQKLAFLKLNDLYRKYEKGQYTLEECKRIKGEIEKEYEIDLIEINNINDILVKYNKNIRYTKDMISNIENTNDKEEILNFALIIASIWIDDMDFGDKIYKKINNIV